MFDILDASFNFAFILVICSEFPLFGHYCSTCCLPFLPVCGLELSVTNTLEAPTYEYNLGTHHVTGTSSAYILQISSQTKRDRKSVQTGIHGLILL